MSFAVVAGAGIAAGGAYLSSRNQAKAAKDAAAGAQFQPWAVSGPGGSGVGFEVDPRTGNRNISLIQGNTEQDVRAALMGDVGRSAIFGGPNQQMAEQLMRGANVPGMFGAAQRVQEYTPDQALRSADAFGRIGAQQGFFGERGLREAFGGPTAADLTQQVQQRGLGLLDSAAPTSFNDLAAQRLSALRGQARPAEERAVNQKFQNLFSSGRLGTTGGQRGLGELALQQELADMSRITESQNFAQGQANVERQFAQNQQQLGAGLLGQAFSGIGQDQQRAMQLGSLGGTMFNLQGQTEAARLGAFQTADQAAVSRGQRRLQNAQQVFGFGDALQQTDLDRMAQRLGITQSMDQSLLDQARLGASVGQAQAAAGANAGALAMKGGSPLAGALTGLGTGLMQNERLQQGAGNIMTGVGNFFGGLFNRGGG